ncbi:MAG: asparagine synthase (glutamine-hydrolyzing) [Aestuariibacter sp.]
MCGISGVVSSNQAFAQTALRNMEEAQKHRGPDVQGAEIYSSGEWRVGLGHQRLSILDLSEAGKQPMVSHSGNSIIAFNGEVYNYQELAAQLEGVSLKSSSDTEIILEMLDSGNLQESLKQFNGMWSIALLDISGDKLYLARDRVGIKPLYYTFMDGQLFYASEIKSLLAATKKNYNLNLQVVSEYLIQSLQDTSTDTFFEGIYAVPPGHYAEIDLSQKHLNMEFHSYWEIDTNVKVNNFEDAVKQTKSLFFDAVKLRMRSDVPVGVTLSGGLDSSSIATAMKNFLAEGQQLRVLSAVAEDSSLDESEFIDAVAGHLHCDVNKVTLSWSPEEAFDLMKKVTWHNDTPLGSFSNVAHYLLMMEAKRLGVTVILSGQGADELLCGYKKYLGFYLQRLLREKRLFSFATNLIQFFTRGTVLKQFNFKEAKRYLPGFMKREKRSILGHRLSHFKPHTLGLKNSQTVTDRQIEDVEHYSVPFLTHYEDRMSMAWSREIRLPFLDYRLINLFLSLPISFKLFKGWTKYVLREAMLGELPDSIIWRKDKQGFLTPQENWLKNELKDQVLSYFSEDAMIFKLGLVDRNNLLATYEEFCEQSEDKGAVWYRDIFNPLALEVWLQVYKDSINDHN